MSQNPTAIAAAIVSRLATIKVANGYQNDVKAIFEVDMTADQIAESLPALFVLEEESGETWEWNDAAVYEARLPFLIGGLVKDSGTDVSDPARVARIRSLEQDVRKALLQDPWFGNTCASSLLRKVSRVIDTDRGFASFALDMDVLYHFHKGSL